MRRAATTLDMIILAIILSAMDAVIMAVLWSLSYWQVLPENSRWPPRVWMLVAIVSGWLWQDVVDCMNTRARRRRRRARSRRIFSERRKA